MNQLFTLGIITIFLGFSLVIISLPKGKTEFFVGGLIGPLPFGFASSKRWLKIGIILTFLSLAAFLFLSFSNKTP